MGYQTQREKIKAFIEKNILPAIKNKTDVDYFKVIDTLKLETGASQSMIEDVLQSFINSGEIEEIRVLSIPKEKVVDWLKEQKEHSEKVNAEISNILEQDAKESRKN